MEKLAEGGAPDAETVLLFLSLHNEENIVYFVLQTIQES